MIPDFKTYVGESLWSDLQNKSMGKSVRKEDNIDLLDLNEFCNYLRTIYKGMFINDIIYTIEDDNELIISLFRSEKTGVYYDLQVCDFDYDPYIYVSTKLKPLFDGFDDEFDIWEDVDDDTDEYILIIKPVNNEEYSNKFFIKVLDFLIEHAPPEFDVSLEKKNKKGNH